MLGVGDALRADPRVFVYGEDVGGQYGNAFLLLRPLLDEFGDRLVNSPLAEGGVLGVCVGAALAGLRPIGEMQFNDFVATGLQPAGQQRRQDPLPLGRRRCRWSCGCPGGACGTPGRITARTPSRGSTAPPGSRSSCPSTPRDARALMAAAVADPDPVLYYEHIALYREPRIKQCLGEAPPRRSPSAGRRCGGPATTSRSSPTAPTSTVATARRRAPGARRHRGAVLDLRSLAPLDRDALLAVARHCARVLIVHEDSRTGGIGESLAAIIQEEAFESLDAPVRILGALDTPVPYSPPLEDGFLPGEDEIERAARLLVAW